MKMGQYIFICMLLTVLGNAFAQEITGFVNDYANILGNEKQQIEEASQRLYDSNIAQIAIVTIDSLEGQSIEDYSLKLAERKLGSKEKDNGLLLLISVEDMEYRFEVGRGLEPIFNDAKVGRYGRDFLVPAFRRGEYGQGVLLVMNELNRELTGEEIEHIQKNKIERIDGSLILPAAIFFVILFLLIIFVIKRSAVRKRSDKNAMKRDDKYFWAAVIASQMMRGKPGGGIGGFGGFGGGSFGGGGASGRW